MKAGFSALSLDLDGTLVDSAPDLTLACQRMLADLGHASVDLAEVRSFVGEGMAKLVERCLKHASKNTAIPSFELEQGIATFRRHYAQTNGQQARLYPGVLEALSYWSNRQIPLACVTNKPVEFTQPLLDQLGIARYFQAVVGGDTTLYKKPHPEPIRFACRVMGVSPENTLHIGDSRHDIEAARAAGATAGAVPYGYPGHQPIRPEEADLFFPTLSGFMSLFK